MKSNKHSQSIPAAKLEQKISTNSGTAKANFFLYCAYVAQKR
jgi:hypothetical protein